MRQKLFSLVILMAACFMQTQAFAQDNNIRKADKLQKAQMMTEKFIVRQTDYVVSQMQLDESKKAGFTELYKKYATELRDSQKTWRSKFARRNKESRKDMSESEIEERIEGRFEHMQNILDIRKKYYGEFKKILKPSQIQQMYKAEKDVQKKVRNEMGRRYNSKKRNNK